MKILIITPFFYPHIGGMERSLFNLAKGLAECHHDVTVYTTVFGGNPSVYPGFKVFRFPIPSLMDWALSIPSFVENYSIPDFCILGGIGKDIMSGLETTIKVLSRKNVMIALRIPTSDHIQRHIRDGLFPEILQSIDYFVCIDKLAGAYLRNYVPEERIRYIPNGVDAFAFQSQVDWRKRDNSVLYRGRISKRKNVEVLLDAAMQLTDRFKFVIQGSKSYGETDYYQFIMSRAANISNIKIIEESWEDISSYQNSRYFVLASESEGCPNSLLEAMSCELLCLSSDIPENREIIQHYGVYFKPDGGALAERLLELSESIQSEHTVKTGREYIVANFSISLTVRKWLNILER